jgi:hypothetical protein
MAGPIDALRNAGAGANTDVRGTRQDGVPPGQDASAGTDYLTPNSRLKNTAGGLPLAVGDYIGRGLDIAGRISTRPGDITSVQRVLVD